MHILELKIPPPVIALLIAGAMWGLSRSTPPFEAPDILRVSAAAMLALAGVGVDLAAIVSFRLARTTVNPLRPETTSLLVCSGIYRLTRNPMYLGLVLILAAWAIFLSSGWAICGPVVFAFYINRFQIMPEERVLSALFGADFAAYQARVRRWL